MESKIHQMIWLQVENVVFIFGINSEFQYTLICRNCSHRSPNLV